MLTRVQQRLTNRAFDARARLRRGRVAAALRNLMVGAPWECARAMGAL